MLIDPLVKKTINEHEQKDAIVKASRAFSESLLAATDVAVSTISVANTSQGEANANNIDGTKDKLIDPVIKKEINESGRSVQIKEFLDSFTPKLLKTLDTIAEIGGEVGADMAATAIGSSLPGDQGKKIAEMTKDLIKGTSASVGNAAKVTSDLIEKPLIKPDVKNAINEHPHREAIKQGLKSFFKKFLPVIEKVAEAGSSIAATAIETTVQGSNGKAVADMTSVIIKNTGKGFNEAVTATEASMSAKLLDPLLKAQIEAHPHREAVKEFLKNFLPKLLSAFEIAAKVGGSIGAELAEQAIEAAMPGAQGEKLAKMTQKMILDTSAAIGKGISNISTTKVEVKIIPNEKDAVKSVPIRDTVAGTTALVDLHVVDHKLLNAINPVDSSDPHVVDLGGAMPTDSAH